MLRSVSCEIVEKKTTVLIGRNGAGKTTTLRAIMGLLKLDGGAIHLDTDDLVQSPAHHRAFAGIGYAPEDRRLVPELSVEENIKLPGLALKLNKAEAKLDSVALDRHRVPGAAPLMADSVLSGSQPVQVTTH